MKHPKPMPAARAMALWLPEPMPLDPMIFTWGSMVRSATIVAAPSMTGIDMSVITTAIFSRCCAKSETASAPLAASSTL